MRKRMVQAAVLAAALGLAGAAGAAELRMMTGPQGGSWIPLGGQLKDLWEKAAPGNTYQVLPGAGIANVRAIEESKAEVGLANSISTTDAIAGRRARSRSPTPTYATSPRSIPQYFQFVVLADAGINKISDLKGKSITTQQKGNTGEVITRHFLEAHGLKYEDVKVSFVGYTELGEPDEGRPCGGLRAQHPGPGRRDHGPAVGARDQVASTRPKSTRRCSSSTRATS